MHFNCSFSVHKTSKTNYLLILCNLRQLRSSESSTQSNCPSHTHFSGMHWPISHLNVLGSHVAIKEMKTLEPGKLKNGAHYKICNSLSYLQHSLLHLSHPYSLQNHHSTSSWQYIHQMYTQTANLIYHLIVSNAANCVGTFPVQGFIKNCGILNLKYYWIHYTVTKSILTYK